MDDLILAVAVNRAGPPDSTGRGVFGRGNKPGPGSVMASASPRAAGWYGGCVRRPGDKPA
jgi:hypothetical protein